MFKLLTPDTSILTPKIKEMQYSTLGTTDIKVSKICLGTMTYGRQNTEQEGHEQMDYALANDVNFFDTAEMYSVPASEKTQGATERIIGTWFKSRGNRDKVVLATKVTGPSANMTYIRNPLRIDKPSILAAIDGSLERLQTDYVDLYQLHWPQRPMNYFGMRSYPAGLEHKWEDNFLEVMETLQSLIKAGKIRHFGVSNESAWGTMRMLHLADKHDLPRPMSIQNAYSLLNRTFETNLSEVAMREKVGLMAYSPLGFGMLTGKYHTETPPVDGRITLFKNYSRYSTEQCREATSQYMAIAKKYNMSMTHLALAFVNSRPFMTANIIGATKMSQLKENIESINIELPKAALKEIETVHSAIPNPAP